MNRKVNYIYLTTQNIKSAKTVNKLNSEDTKLISNILLKTKADDCLVKSLYDSKIDELVNKLNN